MSKKDVAYWAVIDKVVETEVGRTLAGYSCSGMELVASLRSSPVIPFGSFSIDFNSRRWDFTGITSKNIPPYNLKITFLGSALDDALKVFLLCSMMRRKAKAQTLVIKTRTVGAMLTANAIDFNGIVKITAEDAVEMLERKRLETSASTAGTYARHLADFLEFFDLTFYRIADPALVTALEAYASKCKTLSADEGYPAIPPDYLDPLLGTCISAMRDKGENPDFRITAATLILFSQTGVRNSHLLSTKTNALSVSKGVAGMPDITYMRYGDTKPSHADDGEIEVRTIINELALEAYLWLEENCKSQREAIGVDTLVVYSGQKQRYCGCSSFLSRAQRFILFHHESIPCVNTQLDFPDLSTITVNAILKGNTKGFCSRTGLSPSDTVVYPVIHSFRVTVATKLKENGVDMHYIRVHMNQMSEDVTAGYIRSDREIERANSELVYRAIFEDGAELLGQHADEFMAKVNATLSSVGDHAKGSIDEIVRAASDTFPLRMKLLGVCIRCGNVVPCPVSDGSDEILCAFGVCPNQCHLYFMVPTSLEMARNHMSLVKENVSRGQMKAARNELRKAQNIIRSTLTPELESLDRQISSIGREAVASRFPELKEIMDNREAVRTEVEQWQQMKL